MSLMNKVKSMQNQREKLLIQNCDVLQDYPIAQKIVILIETHLNEIESKVFCLMSIHSNEFK